VPDGLIVNGTTSVWTEELQASAELLRRLAGESDAIGGRLRVIDDIVRPASGSAAPAGMRAEAAIDEARGGIVQIGVTARTLAATMDAVVGGYELAEDAAHLLVRGLVGRLLGGLGGPIGLMAVAAVTAFGLLSKRDKGGSAFGAGIPPAPSALRDNNEVITDPRTVGIIRQAVQLFGDFPVGLPFIPPVLAWGAGALLAAGGLPLKASGLMAVGSRLGILDETPVRLAETRQVEVTGPPSGYAERLARVPDADETGGAQVIIERYEQRGMPDRFEVYVSGTVTFSPVADSEPWDMTSNVANVAGYGGGAYASVAEAMKLAGIDEHSPVQFTGYSQGGGVAARLAASGDYNTVGVAAFGGPTGQVPIPAGFPTVIVEHTDDVVPALAGVQDNYAVPAHHREYYAATAQLMDESTRVPVVAAIDSLNRFGEGATLVTSTAYRFERVPEVSETTSAGR
jgi:hypothetical protein